MRKNDYSEDFPSSSKCRTKDKDRQLRVSKPSGSCGLTTQRPSTASNSYSTKNGERMKSSKNVRQINKPLEVTTSEQVDVTKLSQELSRMIFQTTTNPNFVIKRGIDSHKKDSGSHAASSKKGSLNDAQALQIKKILAECLQSFESSEESICKRSLDTNSSRKAKPTESLPFAPVSCHPLGKTSLLRSYLSGSNPTREEYVSKSKNVPNSLISSDSVHHSIFLESGRERRQCLLQYLSNVVAEGQVVIYANSIPGVESLKNFLTKHGFQVNAVHQKMMMAESNWILSEFSLKKFAVLLCAEDHYHSCPAHFRWVKTIINYELPICNPLENWTIRNGIVEFSDNLPVHIYTFIKKSCPLDNELVKLLHLDLVERDQEDDVVKSMGERVYSLK